MGFLLLCTENVVLLLGATTSSENDWDFKCLGFVKKHKQEGVGWF